VTLDNTLQKSNRGPVTEHQYSLLMNSRGDSETIAYPYTVIDRSDANWPSEKTFRDKLNLKHICEARFLDQAGVILYRIVPDVGEWITLDLMKRKKEDIVCERCTSASLPRSWQSVIAIEVPQPFSCPVLTCSQKCISAGSIDLHMKEVHKMSVDNPLLFCNPPRVVHHRLSSCPILECMSHADHDAKNSVEPDPARVDSTAMQLNKKTKERIDANKVFVFVSTKQ
jgi:hypothetical protein